MKKPDILFLFILLSTFAFAQVSYLGTPSSFVTVKDAPFNAKGNTQEVTDAALSNGTSTVTSASGLFVAGDVGKICAITSFTGQVLNWQGNCTITGFTDTNTITISIIATTTYTNATFDWGSNDTTAISNAINSLTSGGTLYFPPGKYMATTISAMKNNITLRGFNRYASVITGNNANWIFQPGGNAITGFRVESLGFDGLNDAVGGFVVSSLRFTGMTFNDCRFYRMNVMNGGVNNLTFTNNIVEDAGTHSSAGLTLNGAAKGARITGNIFRFTRVGFDIGSCCTGATQLYTDVEISGNSFEGGWFLGRTAYTNSGGTVTYTSSALTDSAANFPTLTQFSVIRVLSVRATGTVTSFASNTESQLTDTGATFVSSGVLRGDLIYMGTAVAMVSAVPDETHLVIDEWLDQTTRLPVSPAAAAYTIYKLVLGKYTTSGSSSTVLNTFDGQWFDFYGNTVTPTNGTLYEVQLGLGNYNLQLEQSTRRVRVENNTFKRGWADNLSIFGSDITVVGNEVLDGQDEGITVGGDHNTIVGNHIFHEGTSGIYASCTQCTIVGNNISYSSYTNFANTVTLGDITVTGHPVSNDMIISGNILDGGSNVAPWNSTIHRYGIAARGAASNPIAGVTIANNKIINHTVADIELDGSLGPPMSGIEVYGNGLATINAINGALYASPPSCKKYTLSNNGTNWTVNGTAGIAIPAAVTSSPVLLALPARGIITAIREKTTTAWSGTGFTTMTLSVGDSVGGASYYTPASYDMFAATSNTNFRNTPLFKSASDAGTNVTALITGNQNLNANTITGVTDIEVCSAVLP